MVELHLSELARKMDGRIVQGPASLTFNAFSVDSRMTPRGGLFFALVTERNGHDFIPAAVEKGAGGAVISQQISPVNKDFALIRVKDTLQALQELAQKVLSESPCKVVGITGSIGKTTTKEFTFQLLTKDYNVLKSEGNYNNHLGLPLSLLNLRPGHEIAVLEMGMSHPGEIAVLTRIAPPDVAVITNVRPVHLEFFESVEDIALAKKEILDGTKPEGTAVLNVDDPLVRKIATSWPGRKIWFGRSEECAIRALDVAAPRMEGISFTFGYGKDSDEVRLPFFYDSYLDNFLAAAGAAHAFGIPFSSITARLQALKPFTMRGVHHSLKNDIHLIDDSYNSNPAALDSALKSLTALPSRRRIAVLGDMLELGTDEAAFHLRAGRAVVEYKWDVLIAVGKLSRHMAEGALSRGMKSENIISFVDSEEAARHIGAVTQQGDLILVKGSRRMGMERIVKILLTREK